MKVSILGCGSSGGVPRIGNYWGACDKNEIKNRRRRCGIHILCDDNKSIIIDTPPDMNYGLIDNDINHLDCVLYTHSHADQCHGIDDIRMFYLQQKQKVDIYSNQQTINDLKQKFNYCFYEIEGYPAILNPNIINDKLSIGKNNIEAIEVEHGRIMALGYKINNMAYFPDVSKITDFSSLYNLDLLIIDALQYKPHSSHFHLDASLDVINKLKPKQAILTNMHVSMDYQTLCKKLPINIRPAYDNMQIEI